MKAQLSYRAFYCIFIICLFLSSQGFSQMSGTYTIDPGGGGDFETFTEAVDSLISQGVSAAVTINAVDGNYSEQIVIPEIAGADATNTITFQSESDDSTAVNMIYSAGGSGDNWVIRLDGADFIIIRKLTIMAQGGSYARVINLNNGATYNIVENCQLLGINTTSYYDRYALIVAEASSDEYNIYQNNIFLDGSTGVHYYYGGNESTLKDGTQILNNQFINQNNAGVQLRYSENAKINNNVFDLNNTDASAIWLEYCDREMEIQNNNIVVYQGGTGIWMHYCDGNTIQRTLIANNFVSVRSGGGNTAINLDNCSYQNIFHNSAKVNSTHNDARALYVTNGNNIDVRNNIFANSGWGYAYYINTTSAISVSDNNNYYSVGNYVAYWSGRREDLTDLAAANGMDANSLQVNPVFTSLSDLHTTIYTLDGQGDNTTGITTDIDGEARSDPPDIGADEFNGVGIPLAGIYTIGGTNPDFASFYDAADSLNKVGISATVTFNVRDGNYDEQFTINRVVGADADNSVTFQSESGDSTAVELLFDAGSGSNYIVRFLAADYVNFRNMTFSASNTGYSTIILFVGSTHNDSITGNIFNGNGTGGTNNSIIYSNGSLINDIVFMNNFFSSGYSGIHLDGFNDVDATGIYISNCDFDGQYSRGIFLKEHDAPEVHDCEITTGTSNYYFYGVEFEYCANDLVATGNIISSGNGHGGIFLENCTGMSTKRGLIANNFIMIGGSGTAYGIYTTASNYHNIYYNNIRISSSQETNGRGIFNNNGSEIKVYNNVLSNFGGGYAYYTNSAGPIVESDYNDLYSTGNYIAYWGGAVTDLAALQTTSGMETNSVSVNPSFVSSSDLHVTSSFLDSAATPIAGIDYDIDGELRNITHPDIGADEFTPIEFPLTGIYTIGGTTPDFATFTEAVDKLNGVGIAGWVTFNVRNGNYSEHFIVSEIPGMTENDSVTFQSESGDSTAVVLTYSASSGGNDYVIRLNGADNIIIKNMTIAATGATYGRCISLTGNIDNIQLLNNIFSSTNSSSSSVIHILDDIFHNIRIENNLIDEAAYGIYLNASNSAFATGTVVRNNMITGSGTRGIYLEDQDSPMIIGNEILSNASDLYGIYLEDCDASLYVYGNKIINDNSGYGIRLSQCTGSFINMGLIANNFVFIAGGYTAHGISLNNSEYQYIYHNSCHTTSTHTNYGRTFYQSGGSNISVVDNIFANTGGGYAYFLNDPAAVIVSDHNDYYTTGVNLAYWDNAAVADLAALQTAGGMDDNSLSVDPLFYSDTDLHILQPQLNEAGTPVTEVPDDIDGIERDPATPDIGAMEFYCDTPAFNVWTNLVCFGDSTTFIDSTTNVEIGSAWFWDFDNDWNYDYISTTANESFNWMFDTSGTHTVNLVIDQIAGCFDSYSFDLFVNSSPELDITTQGAYCDSANGEATITVLSGTEPFVYSWSTGSTDATATNLALGTYTVAVTDSLGCISTATVFIENDMVVTVTEIQGSTCGNEDGIASVDASGGYPPYTYIWSNDVTDQTDSTLSPGMHYVNVIDTNGCVAIGSVNIGNNGTGPEIVLDSIAYILCAGENNGVIEITVTGGEEPYTVTWSNGENTEDIYSLFAGVYTVTVRGADSCVTVQTFGITTPTELNVSTVIENSTCAGADGTAVVVVSGGTEPYSYLWPSGGESQIETGMAAGIYAVTVTDANACTEEVPVIINDIGGPAVIVSSITGVSCSDSISGAIDIGVSGGTPPYSYDWNPGGEITQDLTGIGVGTYTVTVSDLAGCKGLQSAEVELEKPPVQPICMVTVDTTNGYNLIVWEKIVWEVEYFNLYKESDMAGVYNAIATVPYDAPSVYNDILADPLVRSWRYKISAVDSCGNESELSDMHKTMHLTSNLGIDNSINLIWDHYQGFEFYSYDVLRYSTAAGEEVLTTIPNNIFTYTDQNPPEDVLCYRVSALKPDTCYPDEGKVQSGPFSQSLSNLDDNGTIYLHECTPDAGEDDEICGDTYTLNGALSDVSSNGTWTGEAGVLFNDTNDPQTEVTVPDFSQYEFILAEQEADCVDSDTVTITFYDDNVVTSDITGNDNVDVGSVEPYFVTNTSNSAYEWFVTGGSIVNGQGTNLINVSWDTDGSGLIAVVETNEFGCVGDTVSRNVTVVGIDELFGQYGISIYPNPNRGIFNVDIESAVGEDVTLKVLDNMGRVVYIEQFNNITEKFSIQIDMSVYSSGIYNLHILTGKGSLVNKIVVR